MEASTNHRELGSRNQAILREVLRTIDPEVQLVLLRGQELVSMTVQPATRLEGITSTRQRAQTSTRRGLQMRQSKTLPIPKT